MDEPEAPSTSGEPRPRAQDRETWKAFWAKQGQEWRTEPEIDAERQAELAARRSITPDVAQGIYPFRGMKLKRADIEWLLATHEHGGCTGGGLWGSPTIDETAGTIFIATGNSGSCGSSEIYGFALVKLSAANLSVLDHFQLPPAERPGDSDFGSTPTLFTTSSSTPMVGVANKNGKYYAFNRNSIATGPVWKDQVATGGNCPQCGNGSISPSAWDGHNLYIGGGNTTISGSSCMGSERQVNPDNGSYLWQHCMGNGPVLGSVTATASGVVAA